MKNRKVFWMFIFGMISAFLLGNHAFAQDNKLTFKKDMIILNGEKVYEENRPNHSIIKIVPNKQNTHILIIEELVTPRRKLYFHKIIFLNPYKSKYKSFPCITDEHEINFEYTNIINGEWLSQKKIKLFGTSNFYYQGKLIESKKISYICQVYNRPLLYLTRFQGPGYEIDASPLDSKNPEVYNIYFLIGNGRSPEVIQSNRQIIQKGYNHFQKWLKSVTDPRVVKIKYYPDPTPYLK